MGCSVSLMRHAWAIAPAIRDACNCQQPEGAARSERGRPVWREWRGRQRASAPVCQRATRRAPPTRSPQHASPAAVETQYGVPSETPCAAAPSRPAPMAVSPCTTSPRHDGRVVDEARRTRQPRTAAARRSGARPPVTGCTSWPAPACRYDSPALTPDASPQRPPLRRAPPLSLSQSAARSVAASDTAVPLRAARLSLADVAPPHRH